MSDSHAGDREISAVRQAGGCREVSLRRRLEDFTGQKAFAGEKLAVFHSGRRDEGGKASLDHVRCTDAGAGKTNAGADRARERVVGFSGQQPVR